MILQEEFEKQGNFLFRNRSYFPLFILLPGLILFLNRELSFIGKPVNPISNLYQILCLVVCIMGFILRIYTVGYSAETTSGRNTIVQEAGSLNTTGTYSIVRHPLYLGNFFIWLGLCMFVQNLYFLIIFILTFWLYYERIMYSEEQFLKNKFGSCYLNWVHRTPAIIPKFNLFAKPEKKFSLRKVLRKEQDGFFALILLVCFFETIGDLIKNKSPVISDLHWYIIFFLGLISYLFLKFLKKKTSVLDI